jgi:hypothetical protein
MSVTQVYHLLIHIMAVDYHLTDLHHLLILIIIMILIKNIMLVEHVILNIRVNGSSLILIIFRKIKFSLFFSSEYDLYPNYRNDSYGISNSSQGVRRHDLPVDLQSPHGGYPPSHRQHPSYPSGSSNHAQYYGIQQR